MTSSLAPPTSLAGPSGGSHGPSRSAGRHGTRQDGMAAKKDPADVQQLAEHPVSLGRIAALFRPFRGRLVIITALIVATSLVGLATPFLTRRLIDDAIPNQDVSLLLLLLAAMLGVTVVTAAFGVVQTLLATVTGQRIMHDLRTTVFEHLQRMPLGFFTRTRGGELQSRLTNDINGMQGVVTNTATSIASNLTTAIGTAVAMAALSWRLSLLSLIVLPPAIYLTRRVARMRRAVTTKAQMALADMQTQIEESLSINGVQLTKTLGSGPAQSQRFSETSRELTELEVAAQLAGRWRMASMSLVFAVIPALIYLAAGLPATSGGMTIGTLVAFTALQAGLFRPLMGVLNVGVQITASLALFSRSSSTWTCRSRSPIRRTRSRSTRHVPAARSPSTTSHSRTRAPMFRRCPTSPCGCPPAGRSPSWARPGRASPPWPRCSPGCTTPIAAASGSTASTCATCASRNSRDWSAWSPRRRTCCTPRSRRTCAVRSRTPRRTRSSLRRRRRRSTT